MARFYFLAAKFLASLGNKAIAFTHGMASSGLRRIDAVPAMFADHHQATAAPALALRSMYRVSKTRQRQQQHQAVHLAQHRPAQHPAPQQRQPPRRRHAPADALGDGARQDKHGCATAPATARRGAHAKRRHRRGLKTASIRRCLAGG